MSTTDHVNLVELGHPFGRRVGVFGAGGKSTLAGAIARKHDLELIELDEIQWMPGWQRRADEEVERIVTERMDSSPQGWVTDHGYFCSVRRLQDAKGVHCAVLHRSIAKYGGQSLHI